MNWMLCLMHATVTAFSWAAVTDNKQRLQW